MLSRLKKSLIAIVIVSSSGLLAPRPANAYLIKLGAGGDAEDAVGAAIVCSFAWTILAIPLCIFSENAPSSAVPQTAMDLVANGYSESEASLILTDRDTLAELSRQNGVALSLSSQDSRVTLARDIRSIHPRASQIFIDFIADQANLP